jgi:hypothetical protein
VVWNDVARLTSVGIAGTDYCVARRDAPSIPETGIDLIEAIVLTKMTTAGRGSLG